MATVIGDISLSVILGFVISYTMRFYVAKLFNSTLIVQILKQEIRNTLTVK